MKNIKELIDNIKGFLDEEEGIHLYELALQVCKTAPCLEIGSYCGKSSVYLGNACKEKNSILFSIDHHRGSEEQQPGEEYFDPELFDFRSGNIETFSAFRETIEKAELTDSIVPIVSNSKTAAQCWATPLSLVFIDGGHSYEAALNDYKYWSPHIVPGGYLLIHDIFKNPEAGGQAPYNVYNIALKSGLYRELPMIKTLGILQRLE
jgi:predicted O-methyltransferase YrrM